MNYLVTIGQFAVLLPLLIGISKISQLQKPGRITVWLLFLWFVAEIALYVTRENGMHNLWVSHLLSPLQFVMLWRFYRFFYKSMVMVNLFIIGLIISVGETIVVSFSNLNSVTLLYQCIFIALLGLITFYQIAKDNVMQEYAWINGALMLLFAGSAVYYSAFLIMDNMRLLQLLSNGHTVLLIVCYVLITIGLWKL